MLLIMQEQNQTLPWEYSYLVFVDTVDGRLQLGVKSARVFLEEFKSADCAN
jgi:hypothetical protein